MFTREQVTEALEYALTTEKTSAGSYATDRQRREASAAAWRMKRRVEMRLGMRSGDLYTRDEGER